ncbi:YbfB/YjiJ family MFS transporter [Pseudomonas sp. MM211]|uniref:YbfB/YjiJ family MFS transporter n=1 Tax=Pseudomonas sp. MM211 TaxID=2866808 RepID=UPI001CECFEBD|nr:YbfB/YjiJ family MFS transporter [Pseudomonas sp. MM211]UCJ16136.1 YbfB/YjiJ family MFS transporter [Pseudomonas sp. MM211]
MTLKSMSPVMQLRSALEAAIVIAIGMGFGRFAYTALYPRMVQENILSLSQGSMAASVNYAGYLVGALLAIQTKPKNAHRFCLWATGGTAACLISLAFLESAWLIVIVRGVAGALSAVAMVAASLWLLQRRRHIHGAPLLYAGVGLGIAVSAELVVLGFWLDLTSQQVWLLLGLVSFALMLLALPGLSDNKYDAQADNKGAPESPVKQWPLVLIYGLAGFGYIITATYLPLLVRTALPELDPGHVWAVFGLGAAPSCFLWHRLHRNFGTQNALALNLAIQALGVILPILLPNGTGYLGSALLVGGTFMGAVTIAMSAAQRITAKASINLLAVMTIIYSVGQVAGPFVADAFYTMNQNFNGSLWAAGIALTAAACISLKML